MKAIMIQGNELYDLLTGVRKMDYHIWEPGRKLSKKERVLLCSAAKKYKGYVCGYALATAEIGKTERYPGEALDGGDLFGWEWKKIHFIEPVPLKMRSRQTFFEVEDRKILTIKGIGLQEWVENCYDPLRTW